MAEIRKREIAFKLRIGEILKGKPNLLPMDGGRDKLNFLELGDKRVIRVNVIANVIDKFISEGEKRFATLTLDDATGQINVKAFGDDTLQFQEINQGQTLAVIGVLRVYNNELYILPEILKDVDPRYLLIRKLEIEKLIPKQPVSSEERIALKDQIISRIKQEEVHEGIDIEKLILDIGGNPELISKEIKKMQEDGMIYEPRPGRVRYLG
jgi:RPA family protein